MTDHPVTPTTAAEFMSNWPPKPARRGPDYAEMVAAIGAGRVAHFDHRLECNAGQYYYASSAEQLDQVIDLLFEGHQAQHEDHYRRCAEGPPVYDGLIFATTSGLFADAKLPTATSEARYDYLRAFGFCCQGIFVTIIDKPSPDPRVPGFRSLSSYPLWETALKQLRYRP